MTVCGCQISFLHNILAIVFVRVPGGISDVCTVPFYFVPNGLSHCYGFLTVCGRLYHCLCSLTAKNGKKSTQKNLQKLEKAY